MKCVIDELRQSAIFYEEKAKELNSNGNSIDAEIANSLSKEYLWAYSVLNDRRTS